MSKLEWKRRPSISGGYIYIYQAISDLGMEFIVLRDYADTRSDQWFWFWSVASVHGGIPTVSGPKYPSARAAKAAVQKWLEDRENKACPDGRSPREAK